MFKKILLGLVVLVAILAVVAAMQPDEFVIERSAVIPAPAADVFPVVNDFHRWAGKDRPADEADVRRPGGGQGG